MRLLLVDSASSPVKFVNAVHAKVLETYANAEVLTRTCATDYDIPFYVSRKIDEYDTAIAFITHSGEEVSAAKVNMVLSKLIDIEVSKGKQVHKVAAKVEEGLSEEELAAVTQEVVDYCIELLSGATPAPKSFSQPTEGSTGVLDFFT